MKVKSFDRKNELMDAALDEFISKSYDEASLNNIIKNAGISKGTFYYHFQDKQALYLSLLQMTADSKIEFLERKLKDRVHNKDLNLFDNLKLQVRFGLEFAREYPRHSLFGLMFQREKGKDIYQVAMNMLDDTSDHYFESMLERAAEKGDFRDGVTPQFAKKMMMYLLYRWDEIFNIKEDALDFDQALHDLDDLIDFIQYGLGRRRPE
jgi:Transcriptional regulator